MPKDYPRSERLASQIQRELAALVRNKLKDPRLSAPTILEVQVSRDLSQARVFFSVLNPDDAEQNLHALKHASGYLQREVGKVLKSRITPRLVFVYDDSDIRGRTMSELIDSVIARDKLTSGE
ncbi:MAG: 30S ribosome-binding factor RbfA [Gammaproteobacteria bacterium]|nr:30S ribosome-binding factor RbfA [Gammaproteobacteria bacterium]MCZ6578265.1 30S ribosome-binding factor RbfA [Gammaproteobacteria bacterium]MCZ6882538.1 30S ribosome-binding factor RbfA [Gammaproteobacteria bacterium]